MYKFDHDKENRGKGKLDIFAFDPIFPIIRDIKSKDLGVINGILGAAVGVYNLDEVIFQVIRLLGLYFLVNFDHVGVIFLKTDTGILLFLHFIDVILVGYQRFVLEENFGIIELQVIDLFGPVIEIVNKIFDIQLLLDGFLEHLGSKLAAGTAHIVLR